MNVSELIEKLKPIDAKNRYSVVVLKVESDEPRNEKQIRLATEIECDEVRYDSHTRKVVLS